MSETRVMVEPDFLGESQYAHEVLALFLDVASLRVRRLPVHTDIMEGEMVPAVLQESDGATARIEIATTVGMRNVTVRCAALRYYH